MKPEIDNKKCIGCGTCAAMCPEVFEIQAGKSIVKKDAPIAEKEDCIKEAKEACPVEAISLSEE
jgi:ferredoxin